MKQGTLVAIALFTCLALNAGAAPVEDEVAQRAERLRGVDSREDETWKFWSANKPQALPVLRRILGEELARSPKSDLVLLDVGYFLAREGSEADKALARRALFAMNPQSKIARANFDPMFKFAKLAAEARDPGVLAFADRAFLRGEGQITVAQPAMRLDPTMVCVFIYGAYGAGAEAHLLAKLGTRDVALRVLEILAWIGTSESVAPVIRALEKRGDLDFYSRAMSVLMMHGGPAGRDALVRLDAAKLEAPARKKHEEMLGQFKKLDYAFMRKSFAAIADSAKLADDEVRSRLKSMYENDGRDDKTSPLALLESGVPGSELIAELVRIRSRMFRRLSDEALSDVEVTNFLINALRYRPAP